MRTYKSISCTMEMHFHISKLNKEQTNKKERNEDRLDNSEYYIFWILKEIDAKIIFFKERNEHKFVVVNDDKTLWHHLPAAYFYPIITIIISKSNDTAQSILDRHRHICNINVLLLLCEWTKGKAAEGKGSFFFRKKKETRKKEEKSGIQKVKIC